MDINQKLTSAFIRVFEILGLRSRATCKELEINYGPISITKPVIPVGTIVKIIKMPEGYTFPNLTERAIRNAIPHTTDPSERWVAIGDTFAVGNTVAIEICKAYGLDPHEFVHGVTCISCNP